MLRSPHHCRLYWVNLYISDSFLGLLSWREVDAPLLLCKARVQPEQVLAPLQWLRGVQCDGHGVPCCHRRGLCLRDCCGYSLEVSLRIAMWSIPLCGPSHHVVPPIMWSVPSRGPSHHVVRPIMWSSHHVVLPSCGLSHHVVRPIMWSVPSCGLSHHGIHPIMVSVPSWFPSHHCVCPIMICHMDIFVWCKLWLPWQLLSWITEKGNSFGVKTIAVWFSWSPSFRRSSVSQ